MSKDKTDYKLLIKTAHRLVDEQAAEIKALKKDAANLKRQLTRCKKKLETEQAKNAEALELVELLEWFHTASLLINQYASGDATIVIDVFDTDDNYITKVEKPSLLSALRAAKKAVEDGK
jgi:uncharacterized membrane protein YccC